MTNTKPIDKQGGYNLLEITHMFKLYLVAGKKSPTSIKNYLSDLRHFLGWLQNEIKSDLKQAILDTDSARILVYKEYLKNNLVPTKTINRRLSMLRNFFAFCISQQWIKSNPAKKVINMDIKLTKSNSLLENAISEYLLQKESSGEEKKNMRYAKSTLLEFINVISLSNKLYEN